CLSLAAARGASAVNPRRSHIGAGRWGCNDPFPVFIPALDSVSAKLKQCGAGTASAKLKTTLKRSLRVERITGRTDGADDVGAPIAIDRLAEAADVDVDGAQLDVAVAAPDRVEQPLARED